MRRLAGLVVVVASCGPGLAPQPPRERNAEALLDASGDRVKLRALMRTSVVNAGLLFEDAACAQEFVMPGLVGADKLDDFARCLATLKLESGPRRSELAGVSVLSYAGLEIEAWIDRGALTWIGYVDHHDLRDAIPTITRPQLEALRIAGDPPGHVTPELPAAADAWLRVCLDGTGNVTSAAPVQVSSALAYDAFATATRDWRFRPFTFHGLAMPACAFVRLARPADAGEPSLPLPLFAAHGPLVIEIAALGKRTGGTDAVRPDGATEAAIDRVKVAPLDTTVRFCIDTRGSMISSTLAQSSGVAPWDAQMVALVRGWKYAPFVIANQPIPVCSYATLVYLSSLSGSRDHH
ncbi:MAG TPA: hypothetical protein VGM39_17215 [Kofleriaceae bacterium]|jgi:hypothetical protein